MSIGACKSCMNVSLCVLKQLCKCLDMCKMSLCLHCNIYSRLKNSDTLQSRMSYSENAMLAVQDVLDAHLHFRRNPIVYA